MRVLLAALYSDKYPSAGETHALSVIAGQLADGTTPVSSLEVCDLVAASQPDPKVLVEKVRRFRPDILGLSVGYGTYSILREVVPQLKALSRPPRLTVYGGALATYLDERILTEVDPDGIVVVGEGEEAFPALLRSFSAGHFDKTLANLSYMDGTRGLVRTDRKLVPVDQIACPDRTHLLTYISQGIQLYAESSRSCSWSHCTFCLRRLLDIAGDGSEFRRMPFQRLSADMVQLRGLNASSFTFADEDFLGGDLEGIGELAEFLESHAALNLCFDASATVHSIFKSTMPELEILARREMLVRLKRAGLRKVFLGIESGSPSQLKRLAKGHSATDAKTAISTLRDAGIVVELGWIMFDPLCTLKEIGENVNFLIDCEATDATSYLYNELRLQTGTGYERLLSTHERRTGRRLVDSGFDPDTLSYDYVYEDEAVQRLVEGTREWAVRLRQIHYPLKNLTRYGVGGELAPFIDGPRRTLAELRLGMCTALLARIEQLEGGRVDGYDPMTAVMASAATEILRWAKTLPREMQTAGLVGVLLRNSTQMLEEISV